ncbi:hypothetical protein [Spiroplasma endosymbiont of Atherix ibis]|uniref:hypothetical protein n=1 Tax=Spiroplasma endosymbiont of Atherix ibis TaxID=3066291 RepID=UPI0030CD692B
MKKLINLILNSLNNPDVIKKISESIVENSILNEKIDNIEVMNLGRNSKTLLRDYDNVESAVQEVIEKEIIPSIKQKNKKNEYIR